MEWLYHVEPVDFANASTEEIRKQLNELGAAGGKPSWLYLSEGAGRKPLSLKSQIQSSPLPTSLIDKPDRLTVSSYTW